MPAVIWPVSLPQAPLSTYSEAGEGNVIRSAVEFGPAKVRRRYSVEIVTYQMSIGVDATQLATFWTFYTSTCECGVQWFDWEDFSAGGTRSYRFIPPRPSVSFVSPGRWRVDYQLESLI